MIRKYPYAREKLNETIQSLATDAGDVRKRLEQSYLFFHSLNETDFPDDLKKDWVWIMQQLTKSGPIYDMNNRVIKGNISNTMRKIKNSTGVKIAERIFKLYLNINNDY